MPNRSLDDFLAGDDADADVDADAATDGDGDAATEADEDAEVDAADVDAADVDAADADAADVDGADVDGADPDTLATYRWTPTGTTCPACGESVQKRWLDGDEYVCADCKDW